MFLQAIITGESDPVHSIVIPTVPDNLEASNTIFIGCLVVKVDGCVDSH
jgi:hypothetical protein